MGPNVSLRLAADLDICELDGEAVVYQERTGRVWYLDRAGTALLGALRAGYEADELVDVGAELVGAEESSRWLALLRGGGLIVDPADEVAEAGDDIDELGGPGCCNPVAKAPEAWGFAIGAGGEHGFRSNDLALALAVAARVGAEARPATDELRWSVTAYLEQASGWPRPLHSLRGSTRVVLRTADPAELADGAAEWLAYLLAVPAHGVLLPGAVVVDGDAWLLHPGRSSEEHRSRSHERPLPLPGVWLTAAGARRPSDTSGEHRPAPLRIVSDGSGVEAAAALLALAGPGGDPDLTTRLDLILRHLR